ncbi:lipoprotein-anchoring transpeptidase ErfK/SrfK [Aliiruegeria haliotis]|uniref:Lipoprotein-anchoring transpeptidase ErfK/SrfK n=1 Tax=Aliiruegeria haliotis TaxID=1280846 RepID=A0A2T0RNB7_9RHOB|nr:L,D-transpeptidase [Aliiruegeria haliotis]PRY22696.1 lipoprotein-anchoring transpeptidase ErfK/SrfK [Aliiruegeria haliotis]
MTRKISRRGLVAGIGALPLLATPALLRAQENRVPDPNVRRNVSSFRIRNWQDHFDTLGKGAIVCDVDSRALHFWDASGQYALYPTSVPRTEELTRRGYTEVVRKKVGPTWTPTASMRENDPSLPEFMPPGPGNPLGTHAMYLSWPAYLIHGTHDTRKIGRPSSSGCFGLYNEMVAELYPRVDIGTQVRVI